MWHEFLQKKPLKLLSSTFTPSLPFSLFISPHASPASSELTAAPCLLAFHWSSRPPRPPPPPGARGRHHWSSRTAHSPPPLELAASPIGHTPSPPLPPHHRRAAGAPPPSQLRRARLRWAEPAAREWAEQAAVVASWRAEPTKRGRAEPAARMWAERVACGQSAPRGSTEE